MFFKRIIITTFLILLVYSLSIGQTVDEMGKTVVYLNKQVIKTENVNGRIVEIWMRNPIDNKFEPIIENRTGTGFIIKHNNRNYLVTAKHVSDFMDSNATIILNDINRKKIEIKFQTLKEFDVIKGARWFSHPIADISLHPIVYPQKPDLLTISTIDISKKYIKLKLLSNVYILGFPLGLGLHETISPIAKKAQLASNITSLDIPNLNPNLKFYLIDQAIAQGYSGSPVYYAEEMPSGISVGKRVVTAGEAISLIGIVSGSLSDMTGGKISLVVPISYLWDILESKEFKRYEESLN